jgi:ATP adenylyltransferase
MKNLYAPWRISYAASTDDSKQEQTKKDECVFCAQLQDNSDEKHFILKRYTHCFVVLNKYPYNAGHLMVLPLNHEKSLDNLSPQARHEIIDATNHCIKVVEKVLKTEGVNVGLNLGRASGAGIPSHIHMHILPRWHGDTNFLPTLADVKVVSFDLKEVFELLKPEFEHHTLK